MLRIEREEMLMNKKWCAAMVAVATLAGGMALAGPAYADEPQYSPDLGLLLKT